VGEAVNVRRRRRTGTPREKGEGQDAQVHFGEGTRLQKNSGGTNGKGEERKTTSGGHEYPSQGPKIQASLWGRPEKSRLKGSRCQKGKTRGEN